MGAPKAEIAVCPAPTIASGMVESQDICASQLT